MSEVYILKIEIETVEYEDFFLQIIQLFQNPLLAVLKFLRRVGIVKFSFVGHAHHHFSFPHLLLRFGGHDSVKQCILREPVNKRNYRTAVKQQSFALAG